MQERHGVDEALHGAARDVEADVGRRVREQLVEIVAVKPGRQRNVGGASETAQALLEAEPVPYGAPERHAALAIAEEVGAGLEQARDRRAQLVGAEAMTRRDRARERPGQVGARLDQVELAVAPDQLV